MNEFDTLKKIENYIKKANCYGAYNYCFTAQMEDKISDVVLSNFGALGAIINIKRKSNKPIGYIINKNEKGIAVIPIIKENKQQKVAIDELIFLNNENIDKIIIKNDSPGFKLIKVYMKDKTKYGYKTAKKIKNIDYHEINLNKFIESCK